MGRENDLELYHTTTVLINSATAVDSDWTRTSTGTMFLDKNQSAKTCVFSIPGLNVGDKLIGFRIVGALGAAADNTTLVDADLRKITKGAGAVTDASVGAISQTSVVTDTALDAAKTFTSPEEVATDYQYYVLVTGTTHDNDACDIFICGIEVDVKKKFGESA